jgi:hypothetical protein
MTEHQEHCQRVIRGILTNHGSLTEQEIKNMTGYQNRSLKLVEIVATLKPMIESGEVVKINQCLSLDSEAKRIARSAWK